MMQREVLEGNIAACKAAILAGCGFYAGYPITPQNSITEFLSHEMPDIGREFVQAESEVAAINMIAGASAGGLRVMTATSGPGFSLMAEGLSFLAAARLPAVILDVQRSGPGGANILPSQSDYNYAVKTLGHGGMRAFAVGPESVQETADWMYRAFDIADEYRFPVVILTDGMIGQMMEPLVLPPAKQDVPARDWIVNGCEGRECRRLNDFSFDSFELERRYKAIADMYAQWEDELAVCETYRLDDAEYVLAAWGSIGRIAKGVVNDFRARGYKLGLIRPVTLHPFPNKAFRALDADRVRQVISMEMSDPPQFGPDVQMALENRIPLRFFTRSGGAMMNPEDIAEMLESYLAQEV